MEAESGGTALIEGARYVAGHVPRRRAVISWALYDLANTIFSINILSLYFPLWLVNDRGGKDSDFGLATSAAMLLMFVTAPFLGAVSDQTRRRIPPLVVTTLVCVGFTVVLGQSSIGRALLFFVIATYFYEAGLIFYDSLLPAVSTDENRGRVGGFGVGIGYIGSFIGLGLGIVAVARFGAVSAKPYIFAATGILFLLFAIPCFLFVRDPRSADAKSFGMPAIKGAFSQLRETTRLARRYKGLSRFLVGRIFYTDAANTLGAFLGIYVTNEIGFTQSQVQLLLLIGIAAAMIGGLTFGFIVDRVGPAKSLRSVLILWIVALSGGVSVPAFDLPSVTFWGLAPLVGIALGGTWASDRPFMLRLSPPRYLGQFYGLYSMVGRFSAVVGPLMWSGIVNGLGLPRPVALASLVLMMLVAFLVVRGVSDKTPKWGPEDLVPLESAAYQGPGPRPS